MLLPAAFLIGLFARAADAPAPTSLVGILANELTREFSVLQSKAKPAPYFLAYEVTEDQTVSESATLGALTSNVRNDARGVDTTVRVGSAKFDNYHPYRSSRFRFTTFTPLSLDDDANQIRSALWTATDQVYRAATRRYLQLNTDKELLVEQEHEDPDFSTEEAAHYAQLPETYGYDADAWAAKIRTWSGEFKQHPKILASGVTFQGLREIRTLVNTEGTTIQQGSNLFRIEIQGAGLAPDGMEVADFTSFEAAEPQRLPDDSVVSSRAHDLASRLDQLMGAPPAEPIVCPAILSGSASAVYFHEIFGHRVEGHRQKNLDEGQTFTKMLNQQVLPPFMSVRFDPTLKTYGGMDLIGYYAYDDEGVKARPVDVVESGVLKTFLLSRSPVGEFTHSNGHGRRQPGFEIVSRQSNLIVESTKKESNAALRAQLIEEIKRQGKPYGLYFEKVSSGYTTTSRQGLQAFTVVPLVVYRVYPDGRPDELIRGVDIVGTPLASFQRIVATSDTPEVFNGYCGAESGSIPVSAVSPAILVSEIETQKKQNAQQKPPILPRPEAN